MKKIFLLTALSLSGLFTVANAQDYFAIVDSVKYKLGILGNYNGDYNTLYAIADECYAQSGNIVIPDSVTFTQCPQHLRGSYAVGIIGRECFESKAGITGITLPNTLKVLEEWCFSECSGLTNISLPSSLKYIKDLAFARTGIISIEIPDSVTSLGGACFCGCENLVSVILPATLRHIGSDCFSSCSSLTGIEALGAYISDDRAFEGCTSLRRVRIGGSVGDNCFYGCTNLESVECNINNINSGRIGYEAFWGCVNLKYLNMGNISSIGTYAFSGGGGANLDTIKVMQDVPEAIYNSGTAPITGDINLEHTVLVVPCNTQHDYEELYPWGNFWTIVEDCSGDNEGVDTPNVSNDYDIYSKDGRVFLRGADGMDATLYTIDGRQIATLRDGQHSQTLPSGVYMVIVGNHAAQKVVVIK